MCMWVAVKVVAAMVVGARRDIRVPDYGEMSSGRLKWGERVSADGMHTSVVFELAMRFPL